MPTPYNLAFIPFFDPIDETKSRIYFFKCTVENTGAFNKLSNWKEEFKYKAEFSLPFPSAGMRYEGKHLTNDIAHIIRRAHSLSNPEIFFIEYLNTVLISVILDSISVSTSTIKTIESALVKYTRVGSENVLFEKDHTYVLAIGIDLSNNNLRLLCINRQVLVTDPSQISEVPILTYSSYTQLRKNHSSTILNYTNALSAKVLNSCDAIVDEFNDIQQIMENINKLNKEVLVNTVKLDALHYEKYMKQAIVTDLIEKNKGVTLLLN